MSTSRVSFGSRAGTAFDYPGGQHGIIVRSPMHGGAYDSLDALATALRTEIATAIKADEPQCTTLELSLSADAVLELVRPGVGPYSEGGEHDLPNDFKHNDEAEELKEDGHATRQRLPSSLVGNIVNLADARQSAIVQRAASRGVILAIENADGFRYSFNNAWTAKDGEGSRFSYICQDSMQNKDRHANGYPRTTKHLKGDVGSRGPRKPTYDCKGSVSIKFSTTKQRCDVYYRHFAIHSTVADRVQLPRPRMPRRPFVNRGPSIPLADDGEGTGAGGLLATLQAESFAGSALAIIDRTGPSNIGRPLKRKRDTESLKSKISPDKPLSLVELLSQSASAKAPPKSTEASNKQQKSHVLAPIAYDVPPWQSPPPPLNNRGTAGYAPPYQPAKGRASLKPVAQPPLQPMGQQPAFRQERSGQPTGNHPQAQGLFATLKPVVGDHAPAKLPATTMYSPTPIMPPKSPAIAPSGYGSTQPPKWRARRSCVRCRVGKRKVCLFYLDISSHFRLELYTDLTSGSAMKVNRVYPASKAG